MAFSLKSTGLKQPELLDALFANAQALGAFGVDDDLPPAVAAFLIRTPASSLAAGHVLLALDATGEMVQMFMCESANFFSLLLIDDVVPPTPVNGKFVDTTLQVFTASPFFLGQLPDTLFPRTKPVLFTASLVSLAPLVVATNPVPTAPAAATDSYGKTDPSKENDRGALLAFSLLSINVFQGKLSDPRRKEVPPDVWRAAIRQAPEKFRQMRLPYASNILVFKAMLTGLFDVKPGDKGDVVFTISNMFRDDIVPKDTFMFEAYVRNFGEYLDATLDTGRYWQDFFTLEVLPRLAKLSSDRDDSLSFKLEKLEDLLCEIGIQLRSPNMYNGTLFDLKAKFSELALFPKLTEQSFNTFCREAADKALEAADGPGGHPAKRAKQDDNKGKKQPPFVPMLACFAWCSFSANLEGVQRTCAYTKCRYSHGPFTKVSASAALVEFRPIMEKKYTHAIKCAAQLKKLSAWMSGTGGFAK